MDINAVGCFISISDVRVVGKHYIPRSQKVIPMTTKPVLLGILVGGGPAPGINSAISSATIRGSQFRAGSYRHLRRLPAFGGRTDRHGKAAHHCRCVPHTFPRGLHSSYVPDQSDSKPGRPSADPPSPWRAEHGLSGYHRSLSHKPGSVSDIVNKSHVVAITDSNLCVLRQLSSSL